MDDESLDGEASRDAAVGGPCRYAPVVCGFKMRTGVSASRRFPGERGNALAKFVADTEPGTVAEEIQKRENKADVLPFLRLDENSQQARGLQSEGDGGGAGGGFINEDVANPAPDGECKRSDFPGVEGVIVRDGGRNFARSDDADEGRKPQAAEARFVARESLKFGDDGWWREDCDEELGQQIVVTKPGEVQDDGGAVTTITRGRASSSPRDPEPASRK